MKAERTILLAALLAAALPARAATALDCMMHANQLLEIRSPVSGLLETVPARRGDRVKKGALLASLESGVERSSVALARHKSEMQGPIASGLARVELLSKKHERRRALAAERAIAQQDSDDADLERRLAEAELLQAREQKQQAALEWRQAREQLERRLLRAPFDGVVVEQYLHPGELVDPGDAKRPVLKLAQVDPLRIEVIAPLALFGRIRPGMAADVLPEKPIGGRHAARVKLVDRIVDAGSGTFGVRLELPNPRLDLPPGIKCRIEFHD